MLLVVGLLFEFAVCLGLDCVVCDYGFALWWLFYCLLSDYEFLRWIGGLIWVIVLLGYRRCIYCLFFVVLRI